MIDEIKNEKGQSPVPLQQPAAVPAGRPEISQRGRSLRGSGEGRRNTRRGGPREERARPEFDSKTLTVRRVARVVAGGRRFNFSVVLVLGNRKGTVGVGIGKAADTAAAIEKATKDARKNLLLVLLTKTRSIPHFVDAKYSSARIMMRPAPAQGLIAGSAARAVLELCGINDVNAKILSGSKNKLNIARATIQALSMLQQPREKRDEQSAKNYSN